jgi:HAD superfamily hydrolase (TIGR01509 family)
VIPRYPVYLFDVDGTLLESAADICGAIQEVLSTTERKDVPFEFLQRYIGRHLLDLFQDIFPDQPPETYDVLIQRYRAIYPARDHRLTKLYPGVAETLAALGGRKATVTTKGTPTTRTVLEKFGLLQYFDHVQGTDGFPHKPAPDVVLASMRALDARPQDCLLVGDSAPDMEAGRRAGVKICAVLYGYGCAEELRRWEPDYIISDIRELGEAA